MNIFYTVIFCLNVCLRKTKYFWGLRAFLLVKVTLFLFPLSMFYIRLNIHFLSLSSITWHTVFSVDTVYYLLELKEISFLHVEQSWLHKVPKSLVHYPGPKLPTLFTFDAAPPSGSPKIQLLENLACALCRFWRVLARWPQTNWWTCRDRK